MNKNQNQNQNQYIFLIAIVRKKRKKDDYNSEQDDYPYDLDDNLEDLIAYSKTSTQGLIPFEDRDFSNNIPSKKTNI